MGSRPTKKNKKHVASQSEQKKALRNRAEDILRTKPKAEKKRSPAEIQSLIHELEVHQIELEMQNEELRQTQQTLLESRDNYADLYELAPVGYITIDDKGLVLEANITVADILGTERRKLVNKRFSQFVFDDDQDIYYKHRKNRQSHLDNKERLSCEIRIMKTDGGLFWAKLDSAPVKRFAEDANHFRIAITDISKLKKVEEKLRIGENRFNNILKLMKSGVGVYRAVNEGQDFIVVHSYRAALSKSGKTNEDLTGKRLLKIFPEIKRHGLLDVLKRVWQTGKPENYPVTIYDGEDIAGWRENYIYRLPTGEIISIYEDITERKKMDLALHESEHLFRSIFETGPDPININRLKDGKFISVNPIFLELLGYAETEVIGKTALDINVWHNITRRKQFFEKLMQDGMVKNFEAEFRRKDGTLLTMQVSAKVLMYKKESHLLAIAHDITDLKIVEKALQKSHEKLQKMYEVKTGKLKESEVMYSTLMEALLTGIYMIVVDKIVFTNEQFAELLGYKKPELLNKSIFDIIHPKDRKEAKNRFSKNDVESGDFEIRGMKKNGDIVYMLGRNTVVYYEGREAILGNVSDITKRKTVEKEKQKLNKELGLLSSKLLSTEELERKRIAGEIHDSIGQALSAIKFSVENSLIVIENGSISSAQEALKKIVPLTQQTIEEVRKIVMDLRPSILDDLGLKATISWFCREFLTIYTNLQIETEILVEETDIPGQMKTIIYRILQEAFNNAAKHSQTEYIRFRLEKSQASLELLIEDKGCGFDVEEVLARTADKRGMGLASMRERALLSGGGFNIRSKPGDGTEIHISWPMKAMHFVSE